MACREWYESERRLEKDNVVVVDSNIPNVDDIDIAAKWQARHNFGLPDAQLLIPTHQGKMWRGFSLHPPQITIWLAETLRTWSCVNKNVGHQLSIAPGRPAETIEVIAECIEKAFELYIRTRAFFMTLAYISICKPNWFPLQNAMQVSEQILGHITCT